MLPVTHYLTLIYIAFYQIYSKIGVNVHFYIQYTKNNLYANGDY